MPTKSKSPQNPLVRRIQALRKRVGLTQKQMADSLELEQSTYHRMENEKQEIYAKYLPKIAKVLGVKIWELFGESEEVSPLDENLKLLMELWQDFDEQDINTIMGLAHNFADKNNALKGTKTTKKAGSKKTSTAIKRAKDNRKTA